MEFLKTHSAELFIVLLLLVAVQFGLLISLNSRLATVRRLIRSLLTGPGGEDLETLLRQCLAETHRVKEKADELETRQAITTGNLRHCLQHVGLVRFDAYNDVSGQQSFSLAMLDANHNGAIITALFGRTDGRCYGKAVADGQTEQALSEEETEALELAKQGGFASRATETPRRRTGRA